LALNQQRVVSRDNLMSYLWPSLEFERAQKNLYVSWYLLSKGLGAERVRDCPYILRKGLMFQLNPELVFCDTDQFEALARLVLFGQSDIDEQTRIIFELESLYRDSLATDLPADRFIDTKMASYRSLMVDTLLKMTRQLREMGELEKALYYARSAYDLDDSREDVYCVLMDTQFEAGQRTSAMQTYFSCKRYLADELGILPSKRTTALYQDLLLDNCR
jgi:DNA-binding SARP family transcriptional activator